MILAASFEFEKGHNAEVQERPSDNVELPQVIFFHVLLFIFNGLNFRIM